LENGLKRSLKKGKKQKAPRLFLAQAAQPASRVSPSSPFLFLFSLSR
jgi:hypothetical protein